MIYGLIILIALCSAIALTPLVRKVAIRFGAIDHPGARKIHCAAVPRLGGLSVCLSFVVTLGIAVLLGKIFGKSFDLRLFLEAAPLRWRDRASDWCLG